MTLGQIVAQYRADHALSQRQFAEKSGLSNGYISMLEKNLNPGTGRPLTPTIDAYIKLATAMGMSLEDLMARADDMPVDMTPGEFRLSDREKDFVRKLRMLDDRGRDAVLHMLDYELKNR